MKTKLFRDIGYLVFILLALSTGRIRQTLGQSIS